MSRAPRGTGAGGSRAGSRAGAIPSRIGVGPRAGNGG